MTGDANPVTAEQFERLLQAALQPLKESVVTKDDLSAFATKDDLNRFATKDDVQQSIVIALKPIKEDIDFLKENMATKEEMRMLQKTLDSDRLLADKRFAWLREGVDQTLIVLGNVEKKLEDKIVDHEGRIKRLEKKAGFAQIAA